MPDDSIADLRLAANAEEPSLEEQALLVDYLFAHRKANVQAFLAQHGIPKTGTKSQLRDRLEAALENGDFRVGDLIALLDSIEGWGNQHIYLYRSSEQVAQQWRRTQYVERVLRQNRCIGLLNRRRPLLLPERATLSAVAWSPARVRFLWVERRAWDEPSPGDDFDEGDLSYKAYRRRVERGVTTFDWDLVSRHAALMIRRLSKGGDSGYDDTRAGFERELEPFMTISGFDRLRVSRGIGRIESSGEARSRQLAHQTKRGGRATFTSRGRKRDALDDQDLNAARNALGNTSPLLGNFYWQDVVEEGREMHVKLYAADQRLGIFGEHSEEEVRHVLSRIRHHCR